MTSWEFKDLRFATSECVLNPEAQWIPKLVTPFEQASRQSRCCFCFQICSLGVGQSFSPHQEIQEKSHTALWICERCLSCLQLPTHREVYCLLPQAHWPYCGALSLVYPVTCWKCLIIPMAPQRQLLYPMHHVSINVGVKTFGLHIKFICLSACYRSILII